MVFPSTARTGMEIDWSSRSLLQTANNCGFAVFPLPGQTGTPACLFPYVVYHLLLNLCELRGFLPFCLLPYKNGSGLSVFRYQLSHPSCSDAVLHGDTRDRPVLLVDNMVVVEDETYLCVIEFCHPHMERGMKYCYTGQTDVFTTIYKLSMLIMTFR